MDVWTLCWRSDQVERENSLVFHYNAKARRFSFAEGTRALFCWYTRDWLASEPCATQQLVAWLPATGCMELQVGRRSTSASQPCEVVVPTQKNQQQKTRQVSLVGGSTYLERDLEQTVGRLQHWNISLPNIDNPSLPPPDLYTDGWVSLLKICNALDMPFVMDIHTQNMQVVCIEYREAASETTALSKQVMTCSEFNRQLWLVSVGTRLGGENNHQ